MSPWGEAVRIGGGIKRSPGGGHLPVHVVQNLPGNFLEMLITGGLVAFKVGHDQQGVVIEHLFKMGDKPFRIGGIAVKSASYLVIDTPGRHLFEGEPCDFKGLPIPSPAVIPQKKTDRQAAGELGSPFYSAGHLVKTPLVALDSPMHHFRGRQTTPCRCAKSLSNLAGHLFADLLHPAPIGLVNHFDFL